jgi:hypothetical protein
MTAKQKREMARMDAEIRWLRIMIACLDARMPIPPKEQRLLARRPKGAAQSVPAKKLTTD